TDQLALRFLNVRGAALGLPRYRRAVSYRLVRRIPGDADSGAVRYPHGWQSPNEQTEPAADGHGFAGRRGWRVVALHPLGRNTWLRAVAIFVLSLPWPGDRNLFVPGRAGQTAPAQAAGRLMANRTGKRPVL